MHCGRDIVLHLCELSAACSYGSDLMQSSSNGGEVGIDSDMNTRSVFKTSILVDFSKGIGSECEAEREIDRNVCRRDIEQCKGMCHTK